MSKQLRVLIVEDSERDADLLLLELRRAGYDISHARVQTAESMRVALKNDWDVVLSDFAMPGFGGMAALSVLKESGSDIPFIIVSGTIGEETAVEALKAGAHDFLVKDRLARLLPAIDREVREARIRRERRDATALLEYAEQALREGEARKTAILASAFDGIVTIDARGSIIDFNPAAERMFGYTSEQALGKEMAELLVPPRLRDRHRDGLARFLATGEGRVLGKVVEMAASRADGTEFPVEVAITVVQGQKPAIFTGYIRDISNRKRSEAERERLLGELEQAVKARDEFLSIASHELRTPLTTLDLQVASAFELVRSGRTTGSDVSLEKLESKLRIATRQVERLIVLVHRLLDVTRITSGRLTISRTEVDLLDLVRSVVDRSRETLKSSGSVVMLAGEGHAVGAWDPDGLESVVGNLLANAIKYGQGKPIEINIDAGADVARMTMTDHGIGIAPQEQERIFQRFERAVSAQHYGGFGIGLWVARQVVEAHGGSIRVVSKQDAGSTFTVELPLASEVKGQ
jgi:PAS domain S-box-containing protein